MFGKKKFFHPHFLILIRLDPQKSRLKVMIIINNKNLLLNKKNYNSYDVCNLAFKIDLYDEIIENFVRKELKIIKS